MDQEPLKDAVVEAARDWNRIRLLAQSDPDTEFQLVVDSCSRLARAVEELENTLNGSH